jgi:hypothetical protein
MVPRRNELRLGSPEAATSSWTRPIGLAGAADRGGHRCGPRDGSRLCAGRWDTGAGPRAARRTGGKTGHFRGGVHRLYAGKTSYLRDGGHRHCEPDACAECECMRTVPRADCRGTGARTERRCDLARPGRRPRLLRAVRECPALRPETARHGARRGARRHHDPRPAKKARSTTGTVGRWSATGARASTDARGSSS